MFLLNCDVHSYNTRSKNSLTALLQTNVKKFSLRFQGPKIYNSLSSEIQNASSIDACRLFLALPSLLQFGRGRLSLVAISFYTLSLLFGRCRLSEFTLAGPQYCFVQL